MQFLKLDTIKKYGLHIVNNIPYKLKIFLFALYCWTLVFFYISKIFNFILGSAVTYFPDYLFLNISNKPPVKILHASNKNGDILTNKLQTFLNIKWDKTLCDDRGGLDLDKFSKYVNSSVIFVAYILDIDINAIANKANNFLNNTLEFTKEENSDNLSFLTKNIRIIVIDIGEKIISKLKNNELIQDDILFDEIDFH